MASGCIREGKERVCCWVLVGFRVQASSFLGVMGTRMENRRDNEMEIALSFFS